MPTEPLEAITHIATLAAPIVYVAVLAVYASINVVLNRSKREERQIEEILFELKDASHRVPPE